jgi:hypothetical protein
MLNIASIDPCFSNNHYRPQNEFHCFHAEVFRFEDGLADILGRVAEQLGVPRPGTIPYEKKSSVQVAGISASVYSRVQQRYAGDFAAFEYDPVRPAANPDASRSAIPLDAYASNGAFLVI